MTTKSNGARKPAARPRTGAHATVGPKTLEAAKGAVKPPSKPRKGQPIPGDLLVAYAVVTQRPEIEMVRDVMAYNAEGADFPLEAVRIDPFTDNFESLADLEEVTPLFAEALIAFSQTDLIRNRTFDLMSR